MKYIAIFLLLLLAACEARNFDSDKRQIIAKDHIRSLMRGNRGISITGFQEDTLKAWPDTAVIHPIRYTLDFVYDDATGSPQSKKAQLIFTPEGNAVLSSEIVNGR